MTNPISTHLHRRKKPREATPFRLGPREAEPFTRFAFGLGIVAKRLRWQPERNLLRDIKAKRKRRGCRFLPCTKCTYRS